ncbi:UNVERIFIED_CONTAM: hypothetical protein O8I53_11455 [Campylobacter lari]
MNNLFHKNVVEKNKKLQTMKLNTLVDAIKQNKSYICSTGEKTRFVNIDIDFNASKLFLTLLRYYNQVFSKSDLNDKSDDKMVFLKYFLPTFHYETNTSQMPYKAKMRLVYVFDKFISKDELVLITEKLKSLIYSIFGAKVDDASKNAKQIFYGTINRVFANQNVRIYNVSKMIEVLDYVLNMFDIKCETIKQKNKFKTINTNNLFESYEYDEAL